MWKEHACYGKTLFTYLVGWGYLLEFSSPKLNCLCMLWNVLKILRKLSWSLTQNCFLQILHTFNLCFRITVTQCLILFYCNDSLSIRLLGSIYFLYYLMCHEYCFSIRIFELGQVQIQLTFLFCLISIGCVFNLKTSWGWAVPSSALVGVRWLIKPKQP